MGNHLNIIPRTIMDKNILSLEDNNMKGANLSGVGGPSPGRVSYVQQVSPNHNPESVCNRNTIRIGTWIVRTLYQCGKLENVKKEKTRPKINILSINEMRQPKNSGFMIDDFKMIYSGGDKHERGVGLLLDQDISKCVLGYWTVSDRALLVKIQGHPFNITIIVVYAPMTGSTEGEIDAFYETLEEAKSQCKPNKVNIIIGDLNAKVGSGTDGRTVGPHGTGERNECGEKWVQCCDSKNMVIMNTWFKEHPRRLYI